MKTFLKVISFPLRFVLFLVLALITGIVHVLNESVGGFLIIASAIIAFIGSLMNGLAIICGIGWAILILIGKADNMTDNIPYLIISVLGIMFVSTLLMFTPVLSEKFYMFFLNVRDWLWAFSLMILKCDVDELRYY